MAEKKDEMGAVTHQLSQVDDDMNKHAKLWSRGMIQLYMIMGIGYLVSTLNGFDSSLMGSINAMKAYQNTFGLTGQGSSTGIIFIIYNLGQIAAFPL